MSGSTASGASAGCAHATVCQMCLRVPSAELRFQLSQCGHQFCRPCVTAFVSHSVAQGRVRLRCPFDRALAQVLEGSIVPHARAVAAAASAEALDEPLHLPLAAVPVDATPQVLSSQLPVSTAHHGDVAVVDIARSPAHRKGARTTTPRRAAKASAPAAPADMVSANNRIRYEAAAGRRHYGQPSQPPHATAAASSSVSAPQRIDVLVVAEHDGQDDGDADDGSFGLFSPARTAAALADVAGGSNCSADSCGPEQHRRIDSDRVTLLPAATAAPGPAERAPRSAERPGASHKSKRAQERTGNGSGAQRHRDESQVQAGGSVVAAATSGAAGATADLHQARQRSAHRHGDTRGRGDSGLARTHAVAAPSADVAANTALAAAAGAHGRLEPMHDHAEPHAHDATGNNTICNAAIAEVDLRRALAGDAQGLARLERFSAMAADQHVRECPVASCGLLQPGSPSAPAMTCARCGSAFCYFHANAHASQPGPDGCAAYEATRASAPDAVATAALVRAEGVKQCPRW